LVETDKAEAVAVAAEDQTGILIEDHEVEDALIAAKKVIKAENAISQESTDEAEVEVEVQEILDMEEKNVHMIVTTEEVVIDIVIVEIVVATEITIVTGPVKLDASTVMKKVI